MILREPRPFQEALESRQAKTILPTTLRTNNLQRLSPQVRERAMFSAAVTDARFLAEADGVIGEVLTGKMGLADARLKLDAYLKKVGYDGQVLSRDLTDLRSIARKNVLIQTNVGLALGYGQWKQAQQPVTLNLYPAQELIRVEPRKDERTGWMERFVAAGGTVFEGRMIALTNSPVWETLSRFGYPYPPFDFNSGMGVRPVTRQDAIAAGLLEENEDMIPESRGLSEEAQVPLEIRNEKLRAAVAEQLAGIAKFDGKTLLQVMPDNSQTAAGLSLPSLDKIRAAKPDPGLVPSRDAVARLQRGVNVTDVTGAEVVLNAETLGHWKFKGDELARQGLLDRAIDTLQDPVEVWDQGNQRVFMQRYVRKSGKKDSWLILFVRPSGIVDNFYAGQQGNLERSRRGRARVYAAQSQ